MKKIFTLFIAALTGISVMFAAEQKVPTQTLELPTTGLVDPWGGSFTSDHNYYLDAENNYIIYYPYAVRNSNQTTWSVTDGGGSNEIASGYDASGIFKGYAYYNAVDKDGKNRCDQIKKSKGSYATYRVTNCTAVSAYIKLGKKGDVIVMNCYEMTNGAPAATAAETTNYTDASSASAGILNITGLDANKEYLVEVINEGSGSNALFYEIAFYYRGIKSVTESLTAATIDDIALSADDLNELKTNHSVALSDSYINAPVVKFTKHIVTTYDDDSTKESDEVIAATAVEGESTWTATTTIGEIQYSVSAQKASSFVVTYMDGSTTLGEENVAPNGHPAQYAQYQSKQLCSFVGWYSDATLETPVADMAAEVINSAKTYYAKFENAYATSFNFEKAVMENGKSYNFLAQLGAQYYATNIKGSLDSLDNSKSDKLRNYAYLGLKVKQNGALLNFRVAQNSVVKIKFGNIAKTPQVAINGGEYADMEITDKVYTHTAEAEEMISIKMMDGNAVVFQQIMINEDLQTPELLPITYAEAEHGTVAGFKLGIPGENIVITLAPDSAYHVDLVKYNDGEEDHVIAPVENVYSFVMPAAEVNVIADFLADGPQILGHMITVDTIDMPVTLGYNATMVQDTLVAAGTIVTMTYKDVKEGWEFKNFIVYKTGDTTLVKLLSDNTFEMPDYDVTISALCEEIQPEMHTVTIGAHEHGSIVIVDDDDDHSYAVGDTVRLIITPADGYELVSANAGNEALIPDEDGNCAFEMPAQDVTVLATFKEAGEGFENIDATAKAVKFFVNGKLLIKRGDKVFDAKGQIVE